MKTSTPNTFTILAPSALVLSCALAAAQKATPSPFFAGPIPEVAFQQQTATTGTSAIGTRLSTDLRPRSDRVYHDTDAEGTLWARGRAYKASFDAAGAAYIPFFGSEALRNFPVTFSLGSATAGSSDIELAHGVGAFRNGDTITFDRGAIREVYDLSPGAVEQSFDVDRRTADGDLTLRVAFESELEPVARGQGIAFENELGRVDYSRAIAIDARGERLALETTVDASAIAITVPDAWLDTAAFPIRIDPTITTYSVATGSQIQHNPDVSWDDTSVRMIVVWESDFSSTDHDVGYACVFPDGSVSNTGWIDLSTDSWREPRVGHSTATLRQLVVATRGASGAPTTEIWGRVLSADGNLLVTGQFRIDAGTAGNGDQPDVGGDNTFDQSRPFCVAWRRDTGGGFSKISVRRVMPDGTLVSVVGDLPASPSKYSKPRVSDTNDGSNWSIVFQREDLPGDHDIILCRPSIDFSIAPTGSLTSSFDDEINPSVSSYLTGTSKFMVVWETRLGNNSNVWAALMNGDTLEARTDLSVGDGSGAADTIEPVIETDGKHYTLVYRNATSGVLKATEMCFIQSSISLGVVQGQVQIDTLTDVGSSAQLASYWSTGASVGSSHHRSLAGVYAAAGDIRVAMVENRVGGFTSAACFGDGSGTACPCGNNGGAGRGCANSVNAAGAVLTTSGNPGLGSEDTLVLSGAGMPANVSCLYFQGTNLASNGTNFGDGQQCAGGTIVRLGTKLNNASGQSQYPAAGDPKITVRGGIPAGGGSRGYQVWYRNAATFCTASTFNLTNGMYVTFAP